MATVTLRELARNTASVIQGVQSSGRPALVTRNGRPVAALLPIDEAALEDWLLGKAPAAIRVAAEADPDLAAGRTRGAGWQQAREETGDAPDPRSAPARIVCAGATAVASLVQLLRGRRRACRPARAPGWPGRMAAAAPPGPRLHQRGRPPRAGGRRAAQQRHRSAAGPSRPARFAGAPRGPARPRPSPDPGRQLQSPPPARTEHRRRAVPLQHAGQLGQLQGVRQGRPRLRLRQRRHPGRRLRPRPRSQPQPLRELR